MSRLCGLNFKENLGDQLFEVLSRRKRSTSASDFIGEAQSKELETSRVIAGPGIGLTSGGGAAGSTNDSIAGDTLQRSRRRVWRSQHSSTELRDDPESTSLPPGRGIRIGAGQPRKPGRDEPHDAPMVQVAADRAENASFVVPPPRAGAKSSRGGWSCGPMGRAPNAFPVAQEAPHVVQASLKPGQLASTKGTGTQVPPGKFFALNTHQSPATIDHLPSNADVKRNGAEHVVHPRDEGRVGPRNLALSELLGPHNLSLSELLCDRNTNNDAASSAASLSSYCFVPPQRKVDVCGTLAEEKMVSCTKEVSTSDHMKFRSEEGAYGEVRLYLKADDLLKSSSARLRDAEVSFADWGFRARIIDSGGGCRTVRAAQLPGDIDSERCTYKIGKDGRDLILKLMKKDTSEQWTSQDIRFACVGDAE
eukprot:TRINITY_DN2529_c0_g1_i12.p1 TRINITY_DN2529_c0_g1~~TRINITY_DN2529_c0_g1_i12.p1  ORF type:complete len:421 (-),score=64.57 TRINITY_DN2529_c0_g1_i12:188-1450(-)